jgi:hypothetical protein
MRFYQQCTAVQNRFFHSRMAEDFIRLRQWLAAEALRGFDDRGESQRRNG